MNPTKNLELKFTLKFHQNNMRGDYFSETDTCRNYNPGTFLIHDLSPG